MNKHKTITVLRQHELAEHIRQLALMEPTEVPVVSCFLDLSAGLDTAKAHLQTRFAEICKQLSVIDRALCEQAYDRVMTVLEGADYKSKGLAIFTRSLAGGSFSRVIELDVAQRTRIVVADVPDIMPLIMLQREHGQYLHASIAPDSIEVYETGIGGRTLRTMAPLYRDSSSESRLATATHLLERVMSSNRRLDVVLDGDQALMQAVFNTLPKKLRKRVIQMIPRRSTDNDSRVHTISLLTHKRYREYKVRQRLNKLMGSIHESGHIVSGVQASLKALDSMVVNGVYVAIDDINLRHRSGIVDSTHSELLEFFRKAIQQDVSIEFVTGCKVMKQAGGIACYLADEVVSYRALAANVVDSGSVGMVA